MPPSDDTARNPRVPLGPVGRYVIENLTQLREKRRLTYQELADRLKELGRPIPTLGLSRIERGARRVDADDLVALAIALEVNPAALLFPRNTAPHDEVKLAEGVSVTALAAWEWSSGRLPLPVPDEITWQKLADLEMNSRPEWHGASVVEWRDELTRRKARMEEMRRVGEASFGHETPDVLPRPEGQPVIVAIVTSGRGVLVGRRQDGTPPWTFIAGWSEPGESPADTLIRECKEEACLEVSLGQLLGDRVHPATGKHLIYYAAHPVHGTDVHVGDKAELAEVRWVSLAEADELLPGMFAPVRDYLVSEIGGA